MAVTPAGMNLKYVWNISLVSTTRKDLHILYGYRKKNEESGGGGGGGK